MREPRGTCFGGRRPPKSGSPCAPRAKSFSCGRTVLRPRPRLRCPRKATLHAHRARPFPMPKTPPPRHRFKKFKIKRQNMKIELTFSKDSVIIKEKEAGCVLRARQPCIRKCSRHSLIQPDNRRPVDSITDFRRDCKRIRKIRGFIVAPFSGEGPCRDALGCVPRDGFFVFVR